MRVATAPRGVRGPARSQRLQSGEVCAPARQGGDSGGCSSGRSSREGAAATSLHPAMRARLETPAQMRRLRGRWWGVRAAWVHGCGAGHMRSFELARAARAGRASAAAGRPTWPWSRAIRQRQSRCSNHEGDLRGRPGARRRTCKGGLPAKARWSVASASIGVPGGAPAPRARMLRLGLRGALPAEACGRRLRQCCSPIHLTHPAGSVAPGDPEAWQLACAHLAGSPVRSPCQASVTGAAARGAERLRATTCSGNWMLGQSRAPRLGRAPRRQAVHPAQLRPRRQRGPRRCPSGRSSRFSAGWKARALRAGAALRSQE